jgi:hypothetical protein
VHLDIRLPIGLLFTLLGLILAAYGLLSDSAVYQRSLGYNLNLTWGFVLLAFGALMLVFGRRGTSGVRPAENTREGRAMEQREHRGGMESDRPR